MVEMPIAAALLYDQGEIAARPRPEPRMNNTSESAAAAAAPAKMAAQDTPERGVSSASPAMPRGWKSELTG